jgi:hypothetical protein
MAPSGWVNPAWSCQSTEGAVRPAGSTAVCVAVAGWSEHGFAALRVRHPGEFSNRNSDRMSTPVLTSRWPRTQPVVAIPQVGGSHDRCERIAAYTFRLGANLANGTRAKQSSVPASLLMSGNGVASALSSEMTKRTRDDCPQSRRSQCSTGHNRQSATVGSALIGASIV